MLEDFKIAFEWAEKKLKKAEMSKNVNKAEYDKAFIAYMKAEKKFDTKVYNFILESD